MIFTDRSLRCLIYAIAGIAWLILCWTSYLPAWAISVLLAFIGIGLVDVLVFTPERVCRFFHKEKHWIVTKTEWFGFAECENNWRCKKCGFRWTDSAYRAWWY
jgi:hypothetical protein